MRLFCKYLLLLVIVVLLSACQGEQEKSTSASSASEGETETTGSIEKKEPAPLEKRVKEEIRVVEEKVRETVTEAVGETKEKIEGAADVDLTVSGDYLKKIDKESENYLASPPESGEEASGSSRKIKVSGGVLLDDREKDLTKKLDGGEVEISIPIN